MKLPLQITFRHMEKSEALEADIRDKAHKLDQYCDQIMSCHVTVDAPHQHHQQGSLYRIGVDLTVPGGKIVASREADQHHAHEDPYVATRDAFNAVQRQLEDYVRKQRHKVKRHEPPPHGKVVRLVPDKDYGIIESSTGTEVYFHRNSLLHGDFDTLSVGCEVRYAEEAGEQGPQASSVTPIGKHHVVD
ncbi:MAG: HPF/RaiA family ribosome-associated protein [Gammaproteobacteria bacterium]|nr:HPF/RaiA family ribosome-associated protein [Gammaproteobacteria bacterium]